MADIIIDVRMPKIPNLYICKTSECPVMFFESNYGTLCPVCWEPAEFTVTDLNYKAQRIEQ